MVLLLSWTVGPLAALPHGECQDSSEPECCESDCAMCFCCIHWLPVQPEPILAAIGISRTADGISEIFGQPSPPHPDPIPHVPKG